MHIRPAALGIAISAGQSAAFWCGLFGHARQTRSGGSGCSSPARLFSAYLQLLCAFVTSVGQLALFRFIAGLGMGGAVPTAIAFGAEYFALPLKGNAFDCAVRGCAGGRYDKRLVRPFISFPI